MRRAYKPKPGYESLQGHLAYSTGATLDVAAALEQGSGQITTVDNLLQSSLENYYGANGRVFDVFNVDDEGNETPVEFPDGMATSPGLITRPSAELQLDENGVAQPDTAQHTDDGYGSLTVADLRDIATERGLEIPTSANKSTVVEALEAHDLQTQGS